eukprot:SAG22_NODE_937_length_6418_cov_124.858680_2_plen_112_part_00
MPKGQPKDPETKKRVDRFVKDKWITQKQYDGLSWNHLLQIGTFNQKKQHHPKASVKGKTNADYPHKKGKRNQMYKKYNNNKDDDKIPKGYHKMPDGSIMKDSDMKKNKNKK